MARQRKEFAEMKRRHREPNPVLDGSKRIAPLYENRATAPRVDPEVIRAQVQAMLEGDRERRLKRLVELAEQTKDKRFQARARRLLQRAGCSIPETRP